MLRPVPHVISIRVCASMERRISNLVDRVEELDEGQARREIRENDAAHARVLRRFSDTDWQDPLHYDLVLNTDRLPTADCVAQVLRIAELDVFEETPASREVLLNLRRDFEASQVNWNRSGNRHLAAIDEPVRREERDFL